MTGPPVASNASAAALRVLAVATVCLGIGHALFLAMCAVFSVPFVFGNPLFLVPLALAVVGVVLQLQAVLAGWSAVAVRLREYPDVREAAIRLLVASGTVEGLAVLTAFTKFGTFVALLFAWGTVPAAVDATLLLVCAAWMARLADRSSP